MGGRLGRWCGRGIDRHRRLQVGAAAGATGPVETEDPSCWKGLREFPYLAGGPARIWHLADSTPVGCRGFIGPVPPPLLIRALQLYVDRTGLPRTCQRNRRSRSGSYALFPSNAHHAGVGQRQNATRGVRTLNSMPSSRYMLTSRHIWQRIPDLRSGGEHLTRIGRTAASSRGSPYMATVTAGTFEFRDIGERTSVPGAPRDASTHAELPWEPARLPGGPRACTPSNHVDPRAA